MARVRIPTGAIVDTAITLIDREGFEALSLSNVAASLGVGPSALYGHIGGLDQLRDEIAACATEHLTDSVRDAAIGVAGPGALMAMGDAYRGFAHQHPGQYASTLRPPSADNPRLIAATGSLNDVFARVFVGCGLSPAGASLAASSTRSAIHGFVALELVSGTSSTHDDQYRHLMEALQRGLAHD